ncbi:hypothetical protein PR048_008857 [Dryococelus australis]|uniref:Uncharacterized protein n=1 Tax=Dryococelus australis TaxID=614101 RepID=A0ABQ9I043_9NEOP|nr:hypothetical protein PR048_008857 [Dryococelus australis]
MRIVVRLQQGLAGEGVASTVIGGGGLSSSGYSPLSSPHFAWSRYGEDEPTAKICINTATYFLLRNILEWSGEIWAALNIAVLRADEGRRKRDIPKKKTHRPEASSDTIPTCENPGATLLGMELVSPRWEASSLTTIPSQLLGSTPSLFRTPSQPPRHPAAFPSKLDRAWRRYRGLNRGRRERSIRRCIFDHAAYLSVSYGRSERAPGVVRGPCHPPTPTPPALSPSHVDDHGLLGFNHWPGVRRRARARAHTHTYTLPSSRLVCPLLPPTRSSSTSSTHRHMSVTRTHPTSVASCFLRGGRCRWSAGFPGDITFPPALAINPALLHPHFTSPTSALETSMLRDTHISSLTEHIINSRFPEHFHPLSKETGGLEDANRTTAYPAEGRRQGNPTPNPPFSHPLRSPRVPSNILPPPANTLNGRLIPGYEEPGAKENARSRGGSNVRGRTRINENRKKLDPSNGDPPEEVDGAVSAMPEEVYGTALVELDATSDVTIAAEEVGGEKPLVGNIHSTLT